MYLQMIMEEERIFFGLRILTGSWIYSITNYGHGTGFKKPQTKSGKSRNNRRGALRDQLDEYIFLTAKPDSYLGYKGLDLTNVKQILFRANWHLYDIYPGGKVEVRLDKPDGELIGEATVEPEQFNTRYRGLFGGLRNPTSEQLERTERYPPLNPAKFFARGSDKNSFTIPSEAVIKETNGVHDLYFVFKNHKPGKVDALFPLHEIVLMNNISRMK